MTALLAYAGVDLDGLVPGEPVALSADGKVMVGYATCGSQPVIYRAVVPVVSLNSP